MRGKKIAISVALSAVGMVTLLSYAPMVATAQTVRSVAAPWVNLYGGNFSKSGNISPTPTTPSPKTGHLDSKTVFNISYVGVPENVKPAVQAAIDVWANNFPSTVPINVTTNWIKQPGAGVLASATPGKYFNGFAGAPDKTLWYPSALANSLAGKDVDPSHAEVTIKINSTVSSAFYLGTDGNCPTGQYDLETILIHEIAHGLGFLSDNSFDTFFQFGSIEEPTPFDAYAQLPDGRRLMDVPSPSLELGKVLRHQLVWSGSNAVNANGGVKPSLYAPATYEDGSSVSHLNESSFAGSGANALMTPNLAAGEVIHEPGPLLLAMFDDMRSKPTAGLSLEIPTSPRNAKAIVGDKSAILTFDPPANARAAQVRTYTIKVNQTGTVITAVSSPVVVPKLINGASFSFSITARNDLGNSEPALTNAVIPQSPWPSTVIDGVANAKYLATGTFQSKPIIVYTDSLRQQIKLATWTGKTWTRTIIDGNSTSGGRTNHDVSGNLSICTGKVGKNEVLNIFYSDVVDKDLRFASFDGKKWAFQVVDGNGAKVQPLTELNRVRTSSDVSVSNACVMTPAGLQVFYRDESQGALLGAVQDGLSWRYEVIDGDRNTDGRTTGDVGFHLAALAIGNGVNLVYDSVLAVNAERQPVRGELRSATRNSAYPEDWQYSTLDVSANATAVAGYSVSLYQVGKSIHTIWLAGTGITVPKADQLRWKDISTSADPVSVTTDLFGQPMGPVAVDSTRAIFGCNYRLCSINKTDRSIRLVSTGNFKDSVRSAWITFGGARYVVVGVGGKLTAFKLT